MKSGVTRRDFINGVAALAAVSVIPQGFAKAGIAASVASPAKINTIAPYPPILDGMRGNHEGSFEVLHELAMAGRSQWGELEVLGEHYDLVVVGAGISGLSAAHFYRKKYPQAKILVLDNHDDFGGHAKRNEFKVGDKTIIGYGGSQTMQEPNFYSDTVKQMLIDVGIDLDKLAAGYDTGFFKRHGLRAGMQFQNAKWGVNKFVPQDLGYFDGYMPFVRPSSTLNDTLDEFPVSVAAKKQLKYLFSINEDKLSRMKDDDKWTYLYYTSYKDFLTNDLGITEQGVFDALEFGGASDFGLDFSAIPAIVAMDYGTMPGWKATGLPEDYMAVGYKEPYVHHFPDGNASVARLIVRKLIPNVVSGNTMEDSVTAKFDYSKLDQAGSAARIRLSSPVVNIQHQGAPDTSKKANIVYVNNGQSYQVSASNIIMACNNRVIPKLCPELPKVQKQALSKILKTPILYTTVVLKNWQAWKKLGIGGVISPFSYYVSATLDFPMSIGEYQFSENPDQPIIVHLERFPYQPNSDKSDHDQFRAGRMEILSTPYETIEKKTKEQLQSLLGEGGFDADSDILAMTVNRWSHGYSAWYNPLFSPIYEDSEDERYPHIAGRKPFGVIRIANSDSGVRAMMETAVEQAHRAVAELG